MSTHQPVLGKILVAPKGVRAVRNGEEFLLQEGDIVHLKDAIFTGENPSVTIAMESERYPLVIEHAHAEIFLDEAYISEVKAKRMEEGDETEEDPDPLSETDQYANEHAYVHMDHQSGYAHAQGLESTDTQTENTEAKNHEGSTFNEFKADISGDDTGDVTEESVLQASGHLNIYDANVGQGHFQVGQLQGNYGTLSIDANGNWVYQLNNSDGRVQALGDGQSLQETVAVKSVDGTVHQLHITVHGTNDVPTLNVQGTDATHGVLQGHDTDATDTLTYGVSNAVGQFGTLSVNPTTGQYTYTPNQSVQGMHYNPQTNSYQGQDSFTVKVSDGHGGETTQTLIFNPNGHVNMVGGTLTQTVAVPVQSPQTIGAGAQTGTTATPGSTGGQSNHVSIDLDAKSDSGTSDTDNLTNDKTPTITGTTTIPFSTVEIFEGSTSLGKVTSDANGSYSFTPTTPLGEAVHTLHAVATDMSGSSGQSSDLGIIIDTQAHGDARILDGQSAIHADSYLNAVEQIHAKIASVHMEAGSKVDSVVVTDSHGNAVSIPQSVIDANIHAGGRVLMLKDVNLSSLSDGTLTVEIKGHDAAGNAFSSTDSIIKDTTTSVTAGLATSSDTGDSDHDNYTKDNTPTIQGKAEAGATVVITDAAGHEVGRGAADASGNYSITTSTLPDGMMQKLTVTSTDQAGNVSPAAHLSFTVDTSITATDATAAATEDQTADSTGQVILDTGAQVTSTDVQGQYGTYHFKPDGSFTYTLDNSNPAVQALPDGQTLPDPVQYSVTDAAGNTATATVTTTITGTNDAAVIQGDLNASVTEDQNLTLNHSQHIIFHGKLTISDRDSGQASFDINLHKDPVTGLSQVGYSTNEGGTLQLNPDGTYSYEIDNNLDRIQSLGVGETLIDHVTVRSIDGTSQVMEITIHGDNDAPKVSGVNTLSAGMEDTDYKFTEADLLSNVSDKDHSDQGHLSVHNLQALKPDGTSAGTITQNSDGSFLFHPKANYSGQVELSYEVQDPHGASVATISALNLQSVQDAATISDAQTDVDQRGVTEDKGYIDTHDMLNYHGHLNIDDPDAGEAKFDVNKGSQTYMGIGYDTQLGGHVLLQANGDYIYTINNTKPNIQALGDGETLTDHVTVRSADGTTKTIALTIHGTNDAPEVSGAVTLSQGTEDTDYTLHTSDLLANASDKDTTDQGHLSIHNLQALKPDGTSAGTVTDNHDGTFTFHPAQDYNGAVEFQYNVQDPQGDSVQATAGLNLQAVNDAATLNASLSVTEDASSGTLNSGWQNLNVQDTDSTTEQKILQVEINGVTHTLPANFADTIAGTYGTFHFTHGTDGHDKWSYSANNNNGDIQGLKAGQSLQDNIVFITADGTRIPAQVDILGSDDGVVIDTPAATTAPLGSVTEDTHTKAEGQLQAHDADKDDSVSWQAQTIKDAHGTFTVDVSGHWTYTLDPTASQPLSANDRLAKGFDVTAVSSDGSTATRHVEVIVQGTNDAPTVSASTIAASEDTAHTFSESEFGFQDQDQHDSLHHITIGSLPASGEGVLTYDGNPVTVGMQIAAADIGKLSFAPASNFNGQASFTYTVNDGHTDSQSATSTLDVASVNDIPTVTQVSMHATEDTDYQLQASDFGFHDVDSGDRLDHVTLTDLPASAQGHFELNGVAVTAGQDIAAADIAHLIFKPAANFNGDVTFKYTVNDGHADSSEATGTIAVASDVDAATVTQAQGSGNEDTAIALSIDVAEHGDALDHVTLSGFPAGSQFSAGHSDGHGGWVVGAADLGSLTLTPPNNFKGDLQMQVVATTSDGSGHTADSAATDMHVAVAAVADTPVIDSFDVNGTTSIATAGGPPQLTQVVTLDQAMCDMMNSHFDQAMNGHVKDVFRGILFLENTDLTEVASLTINGQPCIMGLLVALSRETHNAVLKVAPQAPGLNQFGHLHPGDQIEIVFKPGVDPAAALYVGQLTDNDDGYHAYYNNLFDGRFDTGSTVASPTFAGHQALFSSLATPGHTPSAVSIHEDGDIDLSIQVSTPDTSESLEVRIEGLPAGTTLNHGVKQADGSWLVSASDAASLTATPPKDFNGGIDLTITAISHDGNTSAESTPINRHIDVGSVTDQASLTTGDVNADVDQGWQALPVTAAATDTQDPITGITITDLSPHVQLRLDPSASGTAPVHNADGSWTIDPTTIEHLQVQVDNSDGSHSSYVVHVVTTGPDGVTAEVTHRGHIDINAVIDNSSDLDASIAPLATGNSVDLGSHGVVEHLDQLLDYHDIDARESGHYVIRVPDGVNLIGYRPGHSPVPFTPENDMQSDGHGGSIDRDPGYHTYRISAAELPTAWLKSDGSALQGVDMTIKAEVSQGRQSSEETFHFHNMEVGDKNFAPIGTDHTTHVTEDIAEWIVSNLYDFAFKDVDAGDTLHSMTVTGLPDPSEGRLVILHDERVGNHGARIADADIEEVFVGQKLSADLVQGRGGTLTFIPAPNYHGQSHFSYTLSDGKSDSKEVTETFEVASRTDKADVRLGDLDIGDGHQTQWHDLNIQASPGDADDPITSVVIKNLSSDFELRLQPGEAGTAPIHNSDGSWTIDPATIGHLQVHATTSNGAHEAYTIEVTTTGPDGQTAVADMTGLINLATSAGGTAAPAALAVAAPSVRLAWDSGSDAHDHITRRGDLNVYANKGNSVQYSVDGGHTWSSGFNPVEGDNHVLIRQTDPAGNVSPATTYDFKLDTVAHGVHAYIDTTQNSGDTNDDITNVSNAKIVVDPSTVEPGAKVEFSFDGGMTWTTSGVHTHHEGENTVYVRQTDVAGNVSTPSEFKFTVDTSVADLHAHLLHSDDSGSSDTDGITNNQNADIVIDPATYEAGSKLEFSYDGGKTWTTSPNFARHEGENSILMRQTDVAGNVSTPSEFKFTVDTSVADLHAHLLHSDDSGSSDSDNITNVKGASIEIDASTYEKGATIEFSYDGGTTWTTSTKLVQHEGENSVLMRQTDAAGNVSNPTEFKFTLDTTVEKLQAHLGTADDSGASNTDGITNDVSPSIVIDPNTYEAGAKIEFSYDGGKTWTTSTSFSHHEGENSILMRQTDAAGNVSEPTEFKYTQDTVAPTVTVNDVALTHDNTPDITGTVDDPDARVDVTVGGHTYQAHNNGDGTWTLTGSAITHPIADGQNIAISVSATDIAGNAGHGSGHADIDASTATQQPQHMGVQQTQQQQGPDSGSPHTGGMQQSSSHGSNTPASLTGESGTGTHQYHATLQRPAGSTGDWGIESHNGQVVHTLAGQFGTLAINPTTGELSYTADSSAGVHKSGSPVTGDKTEHFTITLGGQANEQLEVDVHLSGYNVHGHSGHFIQDVKVIDMNSAPLSASDEPDQDMGHVDDVSITIDVDSENHSHDDSGDAPMPPPPPPAEEMEFDLGNAAKLLDEQPKPVASGMEEALKSAATLLEDSSAHTKEVNIVKAVESAEGKEHTPNPNAPDHTSKGEGSEDASANTDDAAEYVPDIHNAMDDQNNNDGSGITG